MNLSQNLCIISHATAGRKKLDDIGRRMNKPRLLVVLLLLAPASLLLANSGVSGKTGLDSIRVDLQAQNLPLREALQNLVAQAGLPIIYHDAMLQDVEVSCQCRNVTLREALMTLLQATPLAFEVTKDGQIVIVRRKVNLKGYIKAAETGEALPYASVIIKGTAWGAASNVDGYFVFVNVPAGRCTLQASCIGYEPLAQPVTLLSSQETFIVSMKPQVLQGAAVAVTAEHLQTMETGPELGAVRMAPQQIARLPAVGDADVFRSLQLLPGISSVSDVTSGLYVRGGTPEQNLVLFDGMTVYHLDHLFGFTSAFNSEAIKDVRVFKGGFPAKFGGRVSGIVELTGKTGSYDKFQTGLTFNLLSGSGIVQVPISGRGAWLLSYRRSYTDYIQSGLYNDIYRAVTGANPSSGPRPGGASPPPTSPATNSTDFYYYDVISKLSYSLPGRDILALSFYNSEDRLDQSQNFGTLASSHEPPHADSMRAQASLQDHTDWGNIGASAKWSRVWNDRLYSSLLAAYSIYNSQSLGALEFGNMGAKEGTRSSSSENNEVRDFSLQWENEWHASSRHRVEFGLEWSRTNINIAFTANDTVNVLQRHDEAAQADLYLQDTWKMLAPLELTIGVRAIHYAPTQKFYGEPRVSFKLPLAGGFWLKGAWGEYHQFVNRITNDNVLNGNRDFWLLADESLAPSFAEHKIMGMAYENRDYLFEAEAYHKNLEGVAEFSRRFRHPPEAKDEKLFFLGTGVARGLELLAQKKNGKVNGWASYTLARVDYTIPPLNQGAPFPADQDRRHEIKLAGNYAPGKWHLAATWMFASGAPYTAPLNGPNGNSAEGGGKKNGSRLPAYHRMDLSCARQFALARLVWQAGISIFNLYDRQNVVRREYVLNANPVIVREVTTLGFTPAIAVSVNFK